MQKIKHILPVIDASSRHEEGRAVTGQVKAITLSG
jgi:hypothetical protein